MDIAIIRDGTILQYVIHLCNSAIRKRARDPQDGPQPGRSADPASPGPLSAASLSAVRSGSAQRLGKVCRGDEATVVGVHLRQTCSKSILQQNRLLEFVARSMQQVFSIIGQAVLVYPDTLKL